MKIREFLNQNSSIGILAAVVLLVISLFIIYRELSGAGRPQPPQSKYFMDLNTGEVFIGDFNALAPIETPSGPHEGEPAGVVANIFACGECEKSYAGMTVTEIEQTGAEVAYLTKFSMEGKQALERMRDEEFSPEEYPPEEELDYRELVADVNADRWFYMETDIEAQMLYEDMPVCPEDKPLRQCYPGRK